MRFFTLDLDVTPHQDSSSVLSMANLKADDYDHSSEQLSLTITESNQERFTTTSKTTSPPSIKPKSIVISSFSERLKRLQEKRASQQTVKSQKTNTIEPMEHHSVITKQISQPSYYDKSEHLETNMSSSSDLNGLKSDENQNNTQSRKHITIEDNVHTGSYLKMDIALNSNSLSKESSMTTSRMESKQPPLNNGLPSPDFMNISTDNGLEDSHNVESESDTEDELPPTPPPPIPDLIPSDESEPELNQEELNQEKIDSNVQGPATVTSKVSFRTRQRKDEWNRRSELLQRDSSKFDSLPLLGESQNVSLDQATVSMEFAQNSENPVFPDIQFLHNDSIAGHRQTISIVTESTTLNDSSTDSLPSLPDTPPPTLPDGLPPPLPEDPPPTVPETLPPTAPETPPPGVSEASPSNRSEPSPIFGHGVLEAPPFNSLEEPTSISNHLIQDHSFSNVPSPEESISLQNVHNDLLVKTPTKTADQLGSECTTESKQDSHVGTSNFNTIGSSVQHSLFSLSENSQEKHSAVDKMAGSIDQLRKRKSEEMEEQNLFLEESKQLALRALGGPDADFQKVFERWTKQVPHSKVKDDVRASDTSVISLSGDELTGKEDDSGTTSRMSITNLKHGSPQDAAFHQQLEANSTQLLQSFTDTLSSGDGDKRQQPSDTNDLKDLAKNDSSMQQVDGSNTGSTSVRQIRVISEGTPPPSPDVRFTRIQKESWKLVKPHSKKSLEDDLSASASTGNILTTSTNKPNRSLSMPKTSSLHSLDSETESPKAGFVLPWPKSKEISSKKSKKPSPISPLAAITTTSPQGGNNIPHSPTSISLDSDDDSIQATSPHQISNSQKQYPPNSNMKQPKKKGAGLFEAIFTSSPKPNLDGSQRDITSKENLSSSVLARDQKHEDIIEQQLAKVKEQRKMTHELLRKDPLALIKSLTPRGSPRNSRPSSFVLGTDIYKV